ncbi:hypothetical protein F4779DRAFT_587799 [Xylariaceae sp. FL0662B]|nr:hypothetical protein F4779DRAFT_587799 [Xylariaceae sp. FL0662B]
MALIISSSFLMVKMGDSAELSVLLFGSSTYLQEICHSYTLTATSANLRRTSMNHFSPNQTWTDSIISVTSSS